MLEVPVGIAFFDLDLRLRQSTPVWIEHMARYASGRPEPGMTLSEALPVDEQALASLLKRVAAGASVCLGDLPSDGGEGGYWDITLAPLLEQDVVTGVLCITRDVSGRVEARLSLEQALEEREREAEQQRQLADGLRDILAVLNSNLPLEEVLDYIVARASRLLGADTITLHHVEYENEFVAIVASFGLPEELSHINGFPLYSGEEDRVLLDGRPVIEPEIRGAEALLPLADEMSDDARLWREVVSRRYRSWMVVPMTMYDEVYGSLAFYYESPRDLSEDAVGLAVAFADQAALAIENARLYNQAEQLAVVRERERLARELHDSITQSLYSLTLLAEAGHRLAIAGNMERVRQYLEEAGGMAQQALKEMRLLVYDLRPLVLKREGLVGALQHRLDAVEKRAGVEARLLVEGTVELPAEVEEGLYRVAQEALNNALKHGAPNRVYVRIKTSAGRVELEVEDDGQGFDLRTVEEQGGLGLISMQERMERLGGELEISSAADGGTTVKAIVEVS